MTVAARVSVATCKSKSPKYDLLVVNQKKIKRKKKKVISGIHVQKRYYLLFNWSISAATLTSMFAV